MSGQANDSFSTFGEMLKHLRRRARLTQKELGIAVGYSEAHVARLESGQRTPDLTTVQALLVQALDLKNEPSLAAELVRLAKLARGEKPESKPESTPVTASKCPNNLPVQLSDFIGREREMQDVLQLLTTTRLLTLTGSGGAGKTRLSIEVGNALVRNSTEYPDGVLLVELAPISDPKLVPDTVMSALKLAEAKRNATEELVEYLRDMQMLIILDNCEHLIRACAELVEALLRGCPNLRILATSREGLNIAGEITHRMPPMVSDEAIQLFTARARVARPDFSVTEFNRALVTEICQRLDGMPLALELAAARLRILSVEQIAARLDDRFHLLTGGARTALPRQQTLRTTIDWSYELLPPEERRLLQQLSVFAGGCAIEAVESVYGSPDSIDLLDQLVNKSLATAVETPTGTRYYLLETIRQYAHEKLVEAGEFEDAQERHLSFFTALALRTAPKMKGSERRYWRNILEANLDNLRAALSWAAHAEGGQAGADLVIALTAFWQARGYNREGIAWIQLLILARNDISASQRMQGHGSVGVLLINIGDTVTAISHGNEALALARQIGDESLARVVEAYLIRVDGRHNDDQIRMTLIKDIEWARTRDDKENLRDYLRLLLEYLASQNDYHGAIGIALELLAKDREVGDLYSATYTKNIIAGIKYRQGKYDEARLLLDEIIEYCREAGEEVFLADGLVDNAAVSLHQQDDAYGCAELQAAIRTFSRVQNAERVAQCVCVAAGQAHLRGQLELAARLLATTAEQYALRNNPHLTFYFEYELRLAALQAAMSPAEFDRAWAAGQQMTLKDAVAEVLSM